MYFSHGDQKCPHKVKNVWYYYLYGHIWSSHTQEDCNKRLSINIGHSQLACFPFCRKSVSGLTAQRLWRLESAHWSVYREGRFSMWQSPSLIGYASCEDSFTWQTSVKIASCSDNGRTGRYSVHSYLGALPFIKYSLWKCYLTRLVWPNVYKNGRIWKKTINRFRWGVFLSPVLIT